MPSMKKTSDVSAVTTDDNKRKQPKVKVSHYSTTDQSDVVNDTISPKNSSTGNQTKTRQPKQVNLYDPPLPQETAKRKKSVINRLDKSFWKVNIAGLSEYLESNTIYGKWFWISLLVFSAATAAYEIYKIVDNYRNTPIVTELSVTAVQKMEFPYVEICLPVSINQKYLDAHPWAAEAAVAIRQSIVSASSSAEMKKKVQLNKAATTKSKRHIPTSSWSWNNANNKGKSSSFKSDALRRQHQPQILNNKRHDDVLRELFPDEYLPPGHEHQGYMDEVWRLKRSPTDAAAPAAETVAEENITLDLNNFTHTYKLYMDMGFSIEEIFLSCAFRDTLLHDLPCKDIAVEVLNPNWGKCFMIRLKDMKQQVPGQGLILIMNSQKANYPVARKLRPKTEGIIVSIHHMYNPYSFKYINVQSGLYTKMSLTAEYDEYLDVDSGPKRQPCVSSEEVNFRVFNLTYSEAACQMDCYQYETLSRCGCIVAQEPRFIKMDVLQRTHFCTTADIQSCVVPNVTNDQSALDAWEQCSSQCYTSCSHWKYGVQLSSMKLFTPSFDFLSRHNLTPDTLVYLHIAFTDLEYTTITQDWAMQLDGLISDFGGQVGLWTGASMVTIIQVPVMLVVLMIIYVYEKLRSVHQLRQAISRHEHLVVDVMNLRKVSSSYRRDNP